MYKKRHLGLEKLKNINISLPTTMFDGETPGRPQRQQADEVNGKRHEPHEIFDTDSTDEHRLKLWPTVRRSPGGAAENSPVFQRRCACARPLKVPQGRQTFWTRSGDGAEFRPPYGTQFILARIPGNGLRRPRSGGHNRCRLSTAKICSRPDFSESLMMRGPQSCRATSPLPRFFGQLVHMPMKFYLLPAAF